MALRKPKIKILVLHGPNLNLLGEREPEVYGTMTLRGLNARLKNAVSAPNLSEAEGVQLEFYQSNSEGKLIDALHRGRKKFDGVVFNPGAYTHYSIALRDAVASIGIPVVEVHLSEISKREKFRHLSVIAPVCVSQISGLGWKSYWEGIKVLVSLKRC